MPMIPFISSYVSSDILRLFSINGPPDLIVGFHDKSEIDFTGDEKLLSWQTNNLIDAINLY